MLFRHKSRQQGTVRSPPRIVHLQKDDGVHKILYVRYVGVSTLSDTTLCGNVLSRETLLLLMLSHTREMAG